MNKPIQMWTCTYQGGRGLNSYYVRRTRAEVIKAMGDSYPWIKKGGGRLVKVTVSDASAKDKP